MHRERGADHATGYASKVDNRPGGQVVTIAPEGEFERPCATRWVESDVAVNREDWR